MLLGGAGGQGGGRGWTCLVLCDLLGLVVLLLGRHGGRNERSGSKPGEASERKNWKLPGHARAGGAGDQARDSLHTVCTRTELPGGLQEAEGAEKGLPRAKY